MAASDPLYQTIVDSIISVFDDFGTEYVIRGAGIYNPESLLVTGSSTRNVKGLVADQQSSLLLASKGSGTWTATKTLLLRADSAPVAGEEIQVDSDWFALSKIVAIKPADVIIVYMLDVTK